MRGIKYRVKISDSVLDNIHGFSYDIAEIFIPDAGVAFNEKGGIFRTKEARGGKDLEEIVINGIDVEILTEYLKIKDQCLPVIKSCFPQCDKLL